MATIRFLLKGLNEKTAKTYQHQTQNVFFRFRPSKELDLLLQVPEKINSQNWDILNECWNLNQYTKGAKSEEKKSLNSEIEKFNNFLAGFRKEVCNFIDLHQDKEPEILKSLIKDFVTKKYFAHRIKAQPKTKVKGKPAKMFDLIDFYIEQRSIEDVTEGTKPLAPNTIKKYKTLQKVLHSFDKNLLVTDINDVWRNAFVKDLVKKDYSEQTQVKYVKDVKMLCKYADSDHNVSKQVLNWSVKANPENVSEFVTFTFADLQKLKNAKLPSEKLNNVRDWLLISCYTSVRVSELFTFDKENITEFEGSKFISVIEQKNRNRKDGGKKMIYLLPEVIEILEKRGGEFPKKISDVKYNEYIKDVCRLAELTHEVEGGKIEVVNNIKRKVKVKAPFCDLVSSHCGRATYVTLFSEFISPEILQLQTNHHSKEMLEKYDKTDAETVMLQKALLVAKAHQQAEKTMYNTKLKVV